MKSLAKRFSKRALFLFVLLVLACTNNPYPDADSDKKILYRSYVEAPRTLDPAVAYTTNAHAITGEVYDTLLEYHYLKRPYELIPALAAALPEVMTLNDGWTSYRFEMRKGLLYQNDPCFELDGPGHLTREVVMEDVAFELMRLADPEVNSPIVEPMSNIQGFQDFSARLMARREADPAFSEQPLPLQYAEVGPIEGAKVEGRYTLTLRVSTEYPQILYWFAMPFTAPVPWEAVEYYDGDEGRPSFSDHPVGAGPYVLSEYDKQSRFVLEANPNWYGVLHPEWKAPAATYPSEGAPGDFEAGRLDPEMVGQPLPFIERIEFSREKESIPLFNKFLQGYYDAAGVIKESFDKVIHEGGLSDSMEESGISLEKSVQPSIFYIGFNMDDATVGSEGGERSRKLRQAMSLVVDTDEYTRLFSNGRGVSAQSPLPPGLFGYDPEYVNPYRLIDLERARELLAEAGYPDGIDPETGRPLELTFDTQDTSAQGRLRFEFFTRAWRQLGINVKIEATNYNQFQEKVRNGAYQLFMWGWIADYPDPENFLFLLSSEMSRSVSDGPNTANFQNPEYDELYLEMKGLPNGPRRQEVIGEMLGILEEERPWIELTHSEAYSLFHKWLKNVKTMGMSTPMTKYRDLDHGLRAQKREAWNRPVLWPIYVGSALVVALVIPGIFTFMRERQ
ncbi:MAG: peptide ABC transporter substrate-binding protein [Deltaproteobacteria bacterium]|nr:peptide ABC transporter substrate-binding protein [Deltaproteobacteria bacterium]